MSASKTPKTYRFSIEIPTPDDPTLSLLWIGGPLKPSKKSTYVWLTTPSGIKILEVEKVKVHPLSVEEAEQCIIDEINLRQSKKEVPGVKPPGGG
jgi:hypothetical protein